MSLKPGLGAPAVADLADVLTTVAGCDALASALDVPHQLRLEKKAIPLGRYLRSKLREKLHFPDKKSTPEAIQEWKNEMLELYKDHVASQTTTSLSQYFDKTHHFKKYLIDKNAQKVLQLETKAKIYSAKKDKL